MGGHRLDRGQDRLIGCTAESLRKWVRQAERDRGLRSGLSSDERERVKTLDREVRELRRAENVRHLVRPKTNTHSGAINGDPVQKHTLEAV